VSLGRYVHDPIAFTDDLITKNEKGQPWRLSEYQRRVLRLAFTWDADGHLAFRLLVWSEPKKSGKTFVAACLGLWWSFVTPSSEVIVCANDYEQAVGRVFRTMVDLCRVNTALAASASLRQAERITVSNGTIITAIASEYRGAAGSRHSLYIVDEPWGIMEERAVRLIEELTPPPTEENAWGLWATTAGWVGESNLLETTYQRGLKGARLDADLELYRADDLTMFWSHTPRQPWLTERYYSEQRRSLRPSTFARLHGNQWVTAESTLLTPELWDACVVREHGAYLFADRTVSVYAGVDASTKGDSSAVVAVTVVDIDERGSGLFLVRHRVWQPSREEPLDLEQTIEVFLRELHRDFRLTAYCDPYQLHRSITTLKAAGLAIEEFPQTVGNTVRMGQTLFRFAAQPPLGVVSRRGIAPAGDEHRGH
jgi:phage terminase large subunit-like protein